MKTSHQQVLTRDISTTACEHCKKHDTCAILSVLRKRSPAPNRQFRKKKKWQPLMESDGLGYISTQEHVTPHIGSTGRYFGFSSEDDEKEYSSRSLSKPDYINRCRRKHAKRPGTFAA